MRSGMGMLLVLWCGVWPVWAAPSQPVELVILHVNDLHGFGFPREYLGSDIPARLHQQNGALFAAATRVKQIRRELFAGDPALASEFARTGDDGILFLDAGDQWSGTLDDTESQGAGMVELLSSPDLDVDASVPGNHAFDFGQPRFRELSTKLVAHHPLLCANLTLADGQPLPGMKPWIICSVRGVRVAIVGLITGELLSQSSPQMNQGLKALDPMESLAKATDELHALPPDRRPDLILVLSHVAFERDMKAGGTTTPGVARLAAMDDRQPGDDALRERNVDLVVDGHSHLDLEKKVDSNTWLVQADHFGLKLGEIRVRWDRSAHKIVGEPSLKRHLLFDEFLSADQEMLTRHRALVDHVKQVRDKPLIPCEAGLALPVVPRSDRAHLDSPAGDILTRAFLEQYNAHSQERAHVAIINQTGVREGLFATNAGVITFGSVQAVSPFENPLEVARIPAGKLLGLLEHTAIQHLSRESWAGLEVEALQEGTSPGAEIHRKLGKVRLLDSTGPVDLQAVDPARELLVVAPGFLMGRELKELIVPGSKKALGWTDVAALRGYLESLAKTGLITRARLNQLLGNPATLTIR